MSMTVNSAPPPPLPTTVLQLLLLCSGYVLPSTLLSARIFADRDTGEARGNALVTLADAAAAQTLRTALNGAVYAGRRLAVDFSGRGRAPAS